VDKIIAVQRDRCGAPIGRADDAALLALGRLLAFVIGTRTEGHKSAMIGYQ